MNDGFCRECSRPMAAARPPNAVCCSRACRLQRKNRLRHATPTSTRPHYVALPARCAQHPQERLAFTTDGWGHTLAVCRTCGVQPVPIRGSRHYDQRIDTRLGAAG